MFKSRRPDSRQTSRPAKSFSKPVVKGPSPIPKKDPDAFPMRINKYLAMKGYSTRRGADELIAKKVVTINGRPAVLGDKVNETDVVEVRKNAKADEYVYYACYKPADITLLDTRKGQEGFANTLPLKGVFPIGSLDRDAAGLIIFTNDRRIIDRLENPAHAHPKTYMVEVREPFRNNFKEKLEAGVSIEGAPAIPCHVAFKGPTAALITITDSKNRIRQICSLFGANVEKLTRTEILNIKLGKLNPNGHRKIDGEELQVFLKSLGL
jgi:23S rRNA pseudouridine2604 synthase